MFRNLRVRMVYDWRQAYKWSSIRCISAGLTVQAALQLPDKVLAHVPEFVLSGAGTFSFICFILAGVGRITQVDNKNDTP